MRYPVQAHEETADTAKIDESKLKTVDLAEVDEYEAHLNDIPTDILPRDGCELCDFTEFTELFEIYEEIELRKHRQKIDMLVD